MRLIDLSHPIRSGMPVYPGDPEVSVTPALELADDGVAVARLELGSHTGTHMDAPSHAVAGGASVDRIPLEWLCGTAAVVQCRTPSAGALTWDDLVDADDHAGDDGAVPRIVCLSTGWDRHYGHEEMLDPPVVSIALAQSLWERGARVLGLDTLSPDPISASGDGMPVHEFWLGHGGVIVENLTGLTALPGRVELTLFPLPLRGGDGSPVRAVARIG